jgi:diguanylate cyclase (GGDEF)-like protein
MISVPFHQDAQVVRRFVLFARVVAVLMCAVALLVLADWWWGERLWTAIGPGQVSMKATAAIGFGLSGASLLLLGEDAARRSRFGWSLSLIVLVIGAVTLAEYLWAVDAGIDRLFGDPLAHPSSRWPGRMAELVALAFVLLGGLGLLAHSRRWLFLREGLAVVVLAIATSGLASYGIAVAVSDSVLFGRVPILSLLLLLLAPLGWLSATPTIGLTRVATADTMGGVLARRLLLPALLLPVLFALVFEVLQSWLRLPETLALAFMALFSGGAVAVLVWWVANLLDKLERQRRESAQLRSDADTDTLTGLANRRAFDQTLAGLLRGQREHDRAFSLLMLDLDRFKSYNDDFGHLAGDEVLRITGYLLAAALRPADLAARYGGEEFALLLPDTDASDAGVVAARILDAYRGFAWPQRAVTISVGLAQSARGDDAADLVRRADAALYAAKHAGRNRLEAAEVPPARATAAEA